MYGDVQNPKAETEDIPPRVEGTAGSVPESTFDQPERGVRLLSAEPERQEYHDIIDLFEPNAPRRGTPSGSKSRGRWVPVSLKAASGQTNLVKREVVLTEADRPGVVLT